MSAQTHPLPTPAAQPQPSPMLFFDTINRYQRTGALKAAIELELFTAIGEGATTPEAIALRCQASVRGVRILCDYLAVLGFISKSDGQYALTQDTTIFLDRRSPAYVGGAIAFRWSLATASISPWSPVSFTTSIRRRSRSCCAGTRTPWRRTDALSSLNLFPTTTA